MRPYKRNMKQELISLIEKYCKSLTPTEEQENEIMELALNLGEDPDAVMEYMDECKKMKTEAQLLAEEKKRKAKEAKAEKKRLAEKEAQVQKEAEEEQRKQALLKAQKRLEAEEAAEEERRRKIEEETEKYRRKLKAGERICTLRYSGGTGKKKTEANGLEYSNRSSTAASQKSDIQRNVLTSTSNASAEKGNTTSHQSTTKSTTKSRKKVEVQKVDTFANSQSTMSESTSTGKPKKSKTKERIWIYIACFVILMICCVGTGLSFTECLLYSAVLALVFTFGIVKIV